MLSTAVVLAVLEENGAFNIFFQQDVLCLVDFVYQHEKADALSCLTHSNMSQCVQKHYLTDSSVWVTDFTVVVAMTLNAWTNIHQLLVVQGQLSLRLSEITCCTVLQETR